MKRFHVHVSVNNLPESIAFYSGLFGAAPSVQKSDYAKWMLEDPRVNFAISQRGHAVGVNHLGFQVDSTQELNVLRDQAQAAEMSTVEQGETTCCYARSDKYWVMDPQGIAWEQFHTLDSVPVFGEDKAASADASACCVPTSASASSCCG